MLTQDSEVSFFARNLNSILDIAKESYRRVDNSIKHNLGLAYENYEAEIKQKYSLSKSFFTGKQPVNLYEYYVGTNIKSGELEINDVNIDKLLIHSRYSIISGTGGSGKSVLMRHLLLNSITFGTQTPILLELRDLNDEEKGFENLIHENLEKFGFDLPNSYIKKAMKNGQFLLLLDGFDEVNHSLRKKLISDIKKFVVQYKDCSIIISTRPDDVFKGIDEFTIFEVMPLTVELAVSLISKISFDPEIKNKFIKSLEKQLFRTHKSFLSNPLLLSIMLLTYSENANIPSKISLFYNQAYEALFHRHDASKGAYTRERKTNLDIQDFSELFTIFSIQTYDKRIFKMSKTECLEYIKNSIKIMNISIAPDDYLQDLLSATCLLVEDGLEISYSHRSFQEYFTALYIIREKSEIQEKLIKKYLPNIVSDNVFKLIFEINQDVFEQKIATPILQEVFEKIKAKKKVGVTHLFTFLKTYATDLIISKNSFGIRQKNNFEYFHFIDFSNRLYDKYDYNDTAIQMGMRWDRFGDGEQEKIYPLRSLSSRSPLIKDVAFSEGWLSIKYLQNAFDTYREILEKQKNKKQSILELLNIKK